MTPSHDMPADERSDWARLGNAVNVHNKQDQIYWTVFGIFWPTNAILLMALFPNGDLPRARWLAFVVSLVGFTTCCVWDKVQVRVLGHMERIERTIDRAEARRGVFLEERLYPPREYVDSLPPEQRIRGSPVRELMPLCTGGGIVFWLVLAIVSIVHWHDDLSGHQMDETRPTPVFLLSGKQALNAPLAITPGARVACLHGRSPGRHGLRQISTATVTERTFAICRKSADPPTGAAWRIKTKRQGGPRCGEPLDHGLLDAFERTG